MQSGARFLACDLAVLGLHGVPGFKAVDDNAHFPIDQIRLEIALMNRPVEVRLSETEQAAHFCDRHGRLDDTITFFRMLFHGVIQPCIEAPAGDTVGTALAAEAKPAEVMLRKECLHRFSKG